MMTDQDIFDTVAQHLLTQNRRSTLGAMCEYRGADGLKCAVGCLIPDELYLREMEGYTATDSRVKPALVSALGRSRDIPMALLVALQKCHDMYEPHQWREQLKAIAKSHNLSSEKLTCKNRLN